MTNVEQYLNRDKHTCVILPKRVYKYLQEDNFLSEFDTDEEKELAMLNLLLLDKVPTEGSTRLINSGDLYNILKDLPIDEKESSIKPDEEDLTLVDNKLKFKDKSYSSENYNGLGKKYLRKNIINGVNVLTQNMINLPNTIYKILYDYSLNRENIEIPENCILTFEGGSIIGEGNIIGNNTIIDAPPTKIFGNNIKLEGTWNVVEAYPEWFGAKGDGETIDTLPIQKVMDYFNTILFSRIYISKPIIFRSDRVVNFTSDSKIYATEDYEDYEDYVGTDGVSHPPVGWSPDCIFELTKVSNVTINGNGAELSMLNYYQEDKGTGSRKYDYSQSRHCIRINCSQNVSIYNLNCNQSGGDGFCLGWGSEGLDTTNNTYQHNENILLYGCGADHNKRQGISVIDGINVVIEGCSLKRSFRMPGAGIDVESNFSSLLYYALRNINISNCYTEGNIEGIRITPQHYSDAVSINVFNHTSYDDQAGLVFNRVGNGGAKHSKAKGSIVIENYSIMCPKWCAINLYNMFASDITIDIRKVFIKNVGSGDTTDEQGNQVNRRRTAIMLIDESAPKNSNNEVDFEEGTYSGNYNISDITIDDDREVSNCFAYIYGEIRYFTQAPLKNIIISNIKGNSPYLNNEPIVLLIDTGDPRILTSLDTNLDSSVYFSITSYDPKIQKYISNSIKTDRGYAPIELYFENKGGINYHLTKTFFIKHPFTFINNKGLGRITFDDSSHCLRYNNDIIKIIDCTDVINSKITLAYNGDYWEIIGMEGSWNIHSNKVGVTNDRPNDLLNSAYDIGFDYYDTVILKKIFAKSINNGNVIWVDAKGYTAALSKGNSTQRPTDILTTTDTGFEYYDTTIGKTIYFKVENGIKSWTDILGNDINSLDNSKLVILEIDLTKSSESFTNLSDFERVHNAMLESTPINFCIRVNYSNGSKFIFYPTCVKSNFISLHANAGSCELNVSRGDGTFSRSGSNLW